MQIAIHSFLHGLREAATIWLVLVGFIALTVTAMCVPDRRRRARAARLERMAAAAKPAVVDALTGPAVAAPAGENPATAVEPVATGSTLPALVLAESADPEPVPVPVGVDRPRRLSRRRQRRQQRREAVAAQAAEVVRYAEEITVAAGRAAVTARRRHDAWVAAIDEQDQAWREYEAADRAAARILRTNAFRLPATPRTTAEYAARERYLHRAATEAYRRGELTVEQLWDALAHRNGWDPSRHPFEQEAALRRVTRDRRLREYRAASQRERAAWYATELAASAKRSLDEEAYAAMLRARSAQPVTAARSMRLPRLRLAPGMTLATR